MKLTYPVELNLDVSSNLENEEIEKYAKVKCINRNTEYVSDYVCVHYALVAIVDDINTEELEVYLGGCTDGYNILCNYFKRISIKQAKKGDIVTYHDISDYTSKYEKPCEENCLHFAIIDKTDGTVENTIIKSKWGSDGVFKSNITEVPNRDRKSVV